MNDNTTSTRTNRIQFLDAAPDKKVKSNGAHQEALAKHEAPTAFLMGFDWGTNTSCIQGVFPGTNQGGVHLLVPTVVGYAKDGIVDGLLPGNARILFGHEALKHRLHLKLVAPMIDGVVHHLEASRDFAKHLRSLINVPAGTETRAVIGVPANADNTARENVRQAVKGLFDRVLLIPEPFLAAMGYRDESKLAEDQYVDPVKNSLYIDIGAGTTDVCLVQGYYPTANDQISLPFAGDKVDTLLSEAIAKTYPDCQLSMIKIREIKEKHSFVGEPPQRAIVTVNIGGKPRKIDFTDQIGIACQALLDRVLVTVKTLIGRASSDSVSELLQNIILAGGGSRIRHLDTELQRLLVEEGYDQPVVKLIGDHYKEFVAKGALKAARQAREDQWQQVVL